MNVTPSVDEETAKEARKVANEMGASLNQLVRNYLRLLTKKINLAATWQILWPFQGKVIHKVGNLTRRVASLACFLILGCFKCEDSLENM